MTQEEIRARNRRLAEAMGYKAVGSDDHWELLNADGKIMNYPVNTEDAAWADFFCDRETDAFLELLTWAVCHEFKVRFDADGILLTDDTTTDQEDGVGYSACTPDNLMYAFAYAIDEALIARKQREQK